MRWKTPSLELGLQGAGATGSGGGGGGDTSARAVAMETETIFSSTVASTSPILSSQLQHGQMQELKSKQGQEQGQEQGQIKQPGWRVEFRPLELQLTDFENAAFAVLVVLLARCVLSQGHNWYMPMSYVHENMRRAQLKDAVLTQKFWFRKNSLGAAAPNRPFVVPRLEEIEMVELSLDEIMNGQKSSPNMLDDKAPFGGLLPQVAQFVRTHLLPEQQHAVRNSEISKEIVKAKDKADDHMTSSDLPQTSQRGLSSQLCHYVKLIRDRAAGRLPTTARWLRNQAIRHPDYVRESGTLTPQIANDLLLLCEKIGMGRISCPELNGRISVDNLDTIEEYDLMFPNFSAVTNSGDTGEFPCTTFDAISVSKNCTTSSCMYKCV